MTYTEFLTRKAKRAPTIGRHVDRAELNPVLFPFQADLVQWAVRKGRAALFTECGTGKTPMQIEWGRLVADRTLIVAPLSVARQTVRDSARLLGVDVTYVRAPSEVRDGPGIWITNYEMVDWFDPSLFEAVVLDESGILKATDGKTRTALIEQFRDTPYRLACSATPAPNDYEELTNHAEFLGVMPRVEMLASFFVHDDEGWRLKGHAAEPMFSWMATWAAALRRPSDLGYSDDGYALPALTIRDEIVDADVPSVGQLFATDIGGVGGRMRARRATIGGRVAKAAEIASRLGQWVVWCGLNDEADTIAKAVPGAVNVHGGLTLEAKAAALEAFQDGEVRVLVSKVRIAGFGMNFQNCHQMVFCGIGDSFEEHYQAIRRCWRFGQADPVDVRIVISRLEGQVAANVRRKEREAALMIDALVTHVAKEHADGR